MTRVGIRRTRGELSAATAARRTVRCTCGCWNAAPVRPVSGTRVPWRMLERPDGDGRCEVELLVGCPPDGDPMRLEDREHAASPETAAGLRIVAPDVPAGEDGQ